MRIAFLDHSGSGLGVAIGLVELGHRVEYTGVERWPEDPVSDLDRMIESLIERYFGARTPVPDPAADLLVVWEGIADGLEALATGANVGHRHDPLRPLRSTINPLIYPARLGVWLDLALRASHTVIVDCSDRQGPREEVLARLPRTTLFAREVPRLGNAQGYRPLPFLYNPIALWLEKLRPASEWLVPAARRPISLDWAFCGTVDNPRYGASRRRLIASVQQRWPNLRGLVPESTPFADVLRILQTTQLGLDLPGAGELCFRLHEYLLLGVPVFRPLAYTIALAPGVAAAIVDDPLGPRPSYEQVRRIYETCYAPHVAAARLLEAERTVVVPAVAPAADAAPVRSR